MQINPYEQIRQEMITYGQYHGKNKQWIRKMIHEWEVEHYGTSFYGISVPNLIRDPEGAMELLKTMPVDNATIYSTEGDGWYYINPPSDIPATDVSNEDIKNLTLLQNKEITEKNIAFDVAIDVLDEEDKLIKPKTNFHKLYQYRFNKTKKNPF